MKKLFIKKIKKRSGYTIIETMIAVSIFIVVVMSGMGALLNANLLHQKSQSMRSILDNLSFIMDEMSRNLRTGYNYHCIVTGPLGDLTKPQSGQNCYGIAFTPQNGDPNNPTVYFIGTSASLITSVIKGIGANSVQLTPDEVVMTGKDSSGAEVSGFSVLGAESPSDATTPDFQQPIVNIRLVGKITFKNIVTPFSLQTSVSQRLVDI